MRISPHFALLIASPCLLILIASAAFAQVRAPGVPASMRSLLPDAIPTAVLPAPDVAALRAEDQRNGDFPLRYGVQVPAALTTAAGRWDVTEDGTAVWRLGIRASGAQSLGLEFSRLELPPGAELFVLERRGPRFLGAYTSANQQQDGRFAIEPFAGDELIVELDVRPDTAAPPSLEIGSVVYDYRDVLRLLELQPTSGDGGVAGSCLIDVNCPLGAPWQVQKRAVLRTLYAGTLCSAALINDAINSGTSYVLTANHCGQGSTAIFYFNYELSGCGSGSSSTAQTVSGCSALANHSTYDCRLLLLSNPIPSSFKPVYAGWTRSTANPTYSFAITHPGGSPKKISVDDSGAVMSGAMWEHDWTQGQIQGGSSGGPAFDQDGFLRGPACCVDTFDCNQTAFFGRFQQFYAVSGLATWLDPQGTNPASVYAFDPYGGTSAPQISGTNPATLKAVGPDGNKLLLQGSGFSGVHSVKINGTPLPQGAFSVLSDTALRVEFPLQSALGNANVEVANALGKTAVQVPVVVCDPPVLDLSNSDPATLLNQDGLELTIGSEPLDKVFLLISTDATPSSLPGIVSLGIGAGFTTLAQVAVVGIDADGWTKFVTIPLSLPPGFKLYVQAAAIPGEGTDLAETSNVQSGTILQ